MDIKEQISRKKYPYLDLICWHMGGASSVSRKEALALYERNWPYVDVNTLSSEERLFIADLAVHEGNGIFFPSGGQPIDLEGVHCV